ncbi:hypothetical protein GCM10027284_42070 [Cyclobacterium sediminis]|uniref:hypothetical protein n=1 Tax=Cyclobacterium amurskyense TaxID=320787 RepID=UPI0030D8629D|tara:strand:- start:3541 stop:3717 length:177 start_codon:yes stop_codon:yes gene_type:complete
MKGVKELAQYKVALFCAITTYGIQSKAVTKYTDFLLYVLHSYPELFLLLGVEALELWN